MGVLKCLAKTLLCPFILIFYSFWIYVGGCFGVYFDRGVRGIFCGLCVCCNWTFKDKRFPANSKSIGPWNGKSPAQLDAEIEWKQVKVICGGKDQGNGGKDGAKLFSGKINPSDICQGQVGDCWLMSALACLSTVDGGIYNAFYTREYTGYGKYRMRLYDKPNNKFVTVAVDDWIPCKRGTKLPLFAQPSGTSGAWVLLLEKAMAKFVGSYAAIDGGSTLWAFECLTGNYVFKLKQEGKVWRHYDLVHPQKGQKGQALLQPTTEQLTPDEVFAAMVYYARKRSVIAASSGAGSDTQSINGIVQGHAYSVTRAVEVEGIKLVELRNPWGTFEWTGPWGDRSTKWKENPKVAKALSFKPSDDGTFWMEFKDFSNYFRNLDFCYRTTGFDDLVIDIHEESPCCGPCLGCIEGCGSFWCCCKGMRALACSNDKQQFQRAPTGCCASCEC